MENIDTEALAVQAIQQARLLAHRAELASRVAVQQAVALLIDSGMSQREVAKLTGLSKSDVARRSSTRPSLGVAQRKGVDDRVYRFADEWIWGSLETANRVVDELLRHGEDAGESIEILADRADAAWERHEASWGRLQESLKQDERTDQ